MAKQYAYNNLAGCVSQHRSRITGTLVGVYNSQQAGLEDDPTAKWTTVCEDHGYLVGHRTLALAISHAPVSHDWCEECKGKQS